MSTGDESRLSRAQARRHAGWMSSTSRRRRIRASGSRPNRRPEPPTRPAVAGMKAPPNSAPAPPHLRRDADPPLVEPLVSGTGVVSDGVLGAAQAQLLVGLISTGSFDDHLGAIQAAIARRHRERVRDASNQRAAELRIGDRVRLNREIRPQYLQGATGTVVGWASQNVVVQLDDRAGRFSTGQLRCPPSASSDSGDRESRAGLLAPLGWGLLRLLLSTGRLHISLVHKGKLGAQTVGGTV